MHREAMKQALEALESDNPDIQLRAAIALRQAIEQAEQAQFVANEVQLNIIRWWPDGFANRLEHVWKDLIGFIPNYKLYDLQRMMAEFGFTMKLYEGDAPPPRQPMPPQSPCEMTPAERKMFRLGWLECEAAHGIKGEA
jgi:hypothetical protein